jgi:hypothetical protein
MKVSVRIQGSLAGRSSAGAIRAAEAISGAAVRHLTYDLQQELEAILQSEHEPDADPDMRRDALERAVRRIWGATL